jgi:tRNA(fMet)-specific endonuclease VapC
MFNHRQQRDNVKYFCFYKKSPGSASNRLELCRQTQIQAKLHGVERADTETRKIRRQAFVEKVIEMIPLFSFDIGVARIYTRIWASLVQRGFTIGSHDLIIAATAISLDYTVITANRRDFEKIEGLRLEVRQA